jgi:hypothetical protein
MDCSNTHSRNNRKGLMFTQSHYLHNRGCQRCLHPRPQDLALVHAGEGPKPHLPRCHHNRCFHWRVPCVLIVGAVVAKSVRITKVVGLAFSRNICVCIARHCYSGTHMLKLLCELDRSKLRMHAPSSVAYDGGSMPMPAAPSIGQPRQYGTLKDASGPICRHPAGSRIVCM